MRNKRGGDLWQSLKKILLSAPMENSLNRTKKSIKAEPTSGNIVPT
jgi:hypothetical protein